MHLKSVKMAPLSQTKQFHNDALNRKERTFGLLENKGSFLIKENFSMSDEALLHVDIDQEVFKAKDRENNEHHIRSRKLPPFRQIPRY
ncbi:MAG: hypothetical protein IE889_08630 [Campylobacterales bacterium]|nr:hypothetical protein [Campylobacterales bacterium]